MSRSNLSELKFAGAYVARIFSRLSRGNKILYRGLVAAAMLAWVISGAVVSVAQEGSPEITSLEKKLTYKKDPGPRAVGVLQLSSNGKATLIPVAIEIDGKFYDAASYKANPIPFALDGGTVYEGERTGSSIGLFTVSGALHSVAANAASPWLATGSWLPAGTAPPQTSLKAESTPVGIDPTDEPPRLTKKHEANAPAPETPAPSSPAPASPVPSSSAPAGTPAPAGSSGSGNSAPTAGGGTGASGTNMPAQDSKTQGGQDAKDSAPADAAKPADKPPTQTAQSGSNDNEGDPNRPRLRRGKPTQPLPDDDIPGYAKPGASVPAAAKGADGVAAKATPEISTKDTVDLVLAISDAHGPDPRPYTFEWGKNELADRHTQMEDLAKAQLRAYLQAQSKREVTATPSARTGTTKTGSATAGATKTAAAKTAPHTAPAAKIPLPVLENVRVRTFDVWANNQPVMVLSADAHLPAAKTWTSGDGSPEPMQYSILLVARTDIYNNLHKMYSGITDKYHLDVTPRMELIDVVDADGDGRGEFFFRATSDIGSGYIIYRPTADSLWKMFDTLNPE